MNDPSQDFKRLERDFYKALDTPAGEAREALLAEAYATDPQYGEELRSLLENHRMVRESAQTDELRNPLPRFGAWQAIRKLGKGGMGDVYLAERADGAFAMSAAVKVAPLALASPQIEERFLAERQLLARLSHPGITRLLDGGVTATGLPYFVMEFIDGETIDRYAAKHCLGTRDRILLLRQMLETLAFVHSQQVLHRDLKPSNVLVDAKGQVKICDFGIAELMAAEGEISAIAALTPEYASPEQARGEAVTARSDIYSAGALMRKLLAGQKRGRGLERIIRKATAENAARRFGSAAEMNAALGNFLEGSRKALRGLAAAAIAAIGLAAIGLTAARWRTPGDESPTLVVLSFADVSRDSGGQALADRLTEGVTDLLARTKGLSVIGRPTAARFDQSRDARGAGKQTGAAYVLDSSVGKSGDLLRVSVRLVRTSDGSVAWQGVFSRPAENPSAVENEIAINVAGRLAARVRPPVVHQPQPEAQKLWLGGKAAVKQNTPESRRNAETLFRRAIDADPEWAAPDLSLAGEIWNRAVHEFRSHTDAERIEILRLARKAEGLDPQDAKAHVVLGMLAMQYDWDWEEAEKQMKLATSADNADAADFTDYAILLEDLRRGAEGEPWMERALRSDPLGLTALINATTFYYLRGEREKGLEVVRTMYRAYPNEMQVRIIAATADVFKGRPDLAWPLYRELREHSPQAAVSEATARAMTGDCESALRLLRPLIEKYPNTLVAAQQIAQAYGFMGDEANALKWLERSADAHEWQVLNVAVNPAFQKMEGSAGFHGLKKRLRLE